jgi:hypothetical protein
VCLQKTKISNWNRGLLVDTVGAELATNVAFLPAVGVWGILIAAYERFFTLSQPLLTTNTILARLTMLVENKVWSITGV